jgi:hypothetical protein
MAKYATVDCEGYFDDEPQNIYSVVIALEEWDGVEDAEDEGIFFYMDEEPLEVGAVVGDNFVITKIYEEIENA